jgi:HPt (histidine-containing phosphotransfer) domain-containing protein
MDALNHYDWTLSADLVELIELGQASAVADVLSAFLRDAHRHLQLAHDSLDDSDFSELRLHAHSLKGTAASVGLTRFASAAAELQVLAEQTDGLSAARVLNELRQQFPAVEEVVSQSIVRFRQSDGSAKQAS